ncbi:MAG: hypothetical protein Q4G60_01385 [bacterium]|nr:hypothetical protein [bacterium]
MDEELGKTLNLILMNLDTINGRLNRMDDRFDKTDDRFDKMEDVVRNMGIRIENVIEKNTKTLFDAYGVAQSHFIDETRIDRLEETVKLHEITICNHSRRLNQAHIM